MTTEAEAALIDFLSQFEQVAFRKCRSGWRGEPTEYVEFTKTYGEWAADLAAVIAATGAGPHADERERLIAILRANPWSMTDYSLEHAAGHILAAGFSYTPEDRAPDTGTRCQFCERPATTIAQGEFESEPGVLGYEDVDVCGFHDAYGAEVARDIPEDPREDDPETHLRHEEVCRCGATGNGYCKPQDPEGPTDDELMETYRIANERAMHEAKLRDGFGSNMARESILAGLRAVAALGVSGHRHPKAQPADRCPKCGGPDGFHDPACVVHPMDREPTDGGSER